MAGDTLHARDGTFVEHWDVIQDKALRESSTSGLPMFGDNFGE
jgi:predicted SnoaL-like aldol condensation-catalyzing enzyme